MRTLRRSAKPGKPRLFDRLFTWLLVYISMILTFAFIYECMANSFYQTSATHEPSFLDNQLYVAQVIANAGARDVQYQASADKLSLSQSMTITYYLNATASETGILANVGFTTTAKSGDVDVQIDISEGGIPSSANAVDGWAYLGYSIASTSNVGVISGSSASFSSSIRTQIRTIRCRSRLVNSGMCNNSMPLHKAW
jgi:hypothetical protein